MRNLNSWLFITLIVALFAACEKPYLGGSEEPQPIEKSAVEAIHLVRIHPKVIRIGSMEEELNFKDSLSSRVWTRVDSKRKLYALNVYEKQENGADYQMYAYGLFSNLSKLAIEMSERCQYKVECLIIEEREDKLYMDKDGFLNPLLHGNGLPTAEMDKFVKSKTENLSYIKEGKTIINSKAITSYPRLVKMYGIAEGFTPKQSNDLTLDMRRLIFGLRFKVVPPPEGKLILRYLGWDLVRQSNGKMYDHSSIYSFADVENAYKKDYSLTEPIKIEWIKADGSVIKEQMNITLKRNIRTTLEVSIDGPKVYGIQLNEETGDMKDETVSWHLKC